MISNLNSELIIIKFDQNEINYLKNKEKKVYKENIEKLKIEHLKNYKSL
jgi:2-iminoacetate synthase ThiH